MLLFMATVQMIILGNWLSGKLCCLFRARTAHKLEEAVWLTCHMTINCLFFGGDCEFSQSSQFQMDKIFAFFRIEYPLNIQSLSMSRHALVSEISFFYVSAFVWKDSGHIPIQSSSLSRFNDAESIPTEKQLCASSSTL